jgi:hypothetical protein
MVTRRAMPLPAAREASPCLAIATTWRRSAVKAVRRFRATVTICLRSGARAASLAASRGRFTRPAKQVRPGPRASGPSASQQDFAKAVLARADPDVGAPYHSAAGLAERLSANQPPGALCLSYRSGSRLCGRKASPPGRNLTTSCAADCAQPRQTGFRLLARRESAPVRLAPEHFRLRFQARAASAGRVAMSLPAPGGIRRASANLAPSDQVSMARCSRVSRSNCLVRAAGEPRVFALKARCCSSCWNRPVCKPVGIALPRERQARVCVGVRRELALRPLRPLNSKRNGGWNR